MKQSISEVWFFALSLGTVIRDDDYLSFRIIRLISIDSCLLLILLLFVDLFRLTPQAQIKKQTNKRHTDSYLSFTYQFLYKTVTCLKLVSETKDLGCLSSY